MPPSYLAMPPAFTHLLRWCRVLVIAIVKDPWYGPLHTFYPHGRGQGPAGWGLSTGDREIESPNPLQSKQCAGGHVKGRAPGLYTNTFIDNYKINYIA